MSNTKARIVEHLETHVTKNPLRETKASHSTSSHLVLRNAIRFNTHELTTKQLLKLGEIYSWGLYEVLVRRSGTGLVVIINY